MMPLLEGDTIVARATASGKGAIAVVRVSGKEAITYTNAVFRGKDLTTQAPNTIHFGTIVDGEKVIDEVLISLFKAPRSFTKEDSVEISCHGSDYIVQQIIQVLLKQGGRLAKPGEFTQRAFLHGQFDLAQAEAVADLIAAESETAHRTALNQMRGGFSKAIQQLRERLIHFASMLELELDFSEEDVEFANRDDLRQLINDIKALLHPLIESFALGNAIKKGTPLVIAGKPNAGKSTLLNALLNEEKAIVSNIPGTTRDIIEETIHIDGITFKLTDTAGIRETQDEIEAIGVKKTRKSMEQAGIILYLFDLSTESTESIVEQVKQLESQKVPFLKVGNKCDLVPEAIQNQYAEEGFILISAGAQTNLEELKEKILSATHLDQINQTDALVSNIRHYESLRQSQEALNAVLEGVGQNLSNELLVFDIRKALHHLGEITGEVTTDDLLDNIFSKFCIGK